MKKIFILIPFLYLLWSCGSSEEVGSGFDRKTMLTLYADEFIIPTFAELKQQTAQLNSSIQKLSFQPTLENLTLAQTDWKQTMLVWQKANGFNFGPASDQFGKLDQNIAIFPISPEKIEQFVAKGDTALQNFDRDSRGLMGVEYLLFGDSQAEVIAKLSGTRAAYLRSISADVAKRVASVSDKWAQYRSEFLASTGTDGGSSASLLYNEFVGNFESIKNFKVGLPLGKRPGQTQPEPARVEAFYSGMTSELIKRNFASTLALWEGKNAAGWKTYLENVVGGKELIAATLVQIQATQKAIDALPNDVPFSVLCQEGDKLAENAHTELQKLTRFFKSDMSSLLGIAITYQSGDGD
jgi:predicted lipoprotein